MSKTGQSFEHLKSVVNYNSVYSRTYYAPNKPQGDVDKIKNIYLENVKKFSNLNVQIPIKPSNRLRLMTWNVRY